MKYFWLHRLTGFLMEKYLKDFLNLKMSYTFFFHKNSKLADFCWDDKWLPVIYYLIDIYKIMEVLYSIKEKVLF